MADSDFDTKAIQQNEELRAGLRAEIAALRAKLDLEAREGERLRAACGAHAGDVRRDVVRCVGWIKEMKGGLAALPSCQEP